jgi:pyruvate dehydrogenase E2 component (dihydrolipoamide acetyltransferase)
MEPFREVRSPERNYGPARLPGGTVVTPLARRFAGEAGIDLANVKGSGPRGRIVAADVEQARKAPTPAAAQAVMPIVLTADVEITDALALRDEANAALEKNGKRLLALADVIIKAWAVAFARIMSTQPEIFLGIGKSGLLFRNAAQLPLTAISAVGASEEARNAPTAISISAVEGITSVADVLRPPQTTLLSIGAPRRVPVEASDGAVKFVSMITATLTCDSAALDAARAAALLAAFKGFVEKPVTMIV